MICRMDLTRRFAANLIEQREKARLTPEELATRAELPLTEIESIEAGEKEPELGALVKLVGSLEVPVGVLVAGLAWDPAEGFGED
jgi:transcriptional regulator with XRE-family HTH domain